MSTMSSYIKPNETIEYFCREYCRDKSQKKPPTFTAKIEKVGTIFPQMTNGRITKLDDISGTKTKEKGVVPGLAKNWPGDLFQAKTFQKDGKEEPVRIRLFAIQGDGDTVHFYKSDTHELRFASVSSFGEQTRVAEKERACNNKVPGTTDSVLFSEDLVQKAMKNSKVKKTEELDQFVETDPSSDEMPQKVPQTPEKKKRGRPKKVKVEGEEPEKRKRGRPKKIENGDSPPKDAEKRKRGRPKKTEEEPKKKSKASKNTTLSEILKDYVILGEKLQKLGQSTSEELSQEEQVIMTNEGLVDIN